MAYERTWAFSYNNLYIPTSNLDQTRYQMWALKAMLLGQLGGLVSGLWTTYGSCDGAGNFGNGDLIDRWGSIYDPTKIVRGTAGNAHSWYVLKSPLMNGLNFYLLISFDGAADTSATLLMAKAAFASGSNTANPTSADQWLLGLVAGLWNLGAGAGVLNRFNLALSSVGDFLFFVVQAGQVTPNGLASLGIAVVAPVGTDGSDGYPVWSFKAFQSSVPGGFNAVNIMTIAATASPTRSAAGAAASINIIGNTTMSPNFNAPDILTGKFPAQPAQVLVNTGTLWHMRGRLPDISFVFNASLGNFPRSGVTLRDGSNNVTFVLVGCLWVPCASAVPVFA